MTIFLQKRKRVPNGITWNQRAVAVVFGIVILQMIQFNYNNHVLNHSTLEKNESFLLEMKNRSSVGKTHTDNDSPHATMVKRVVTDQDSVIHNVNQNIAKTKIVTTQSTSKRKPLLVIHVGPNKSGTTYFQSLLSNPGPQEYLLKDNYIFIGRCNEAQRFKNCFYRNKYKSPFTDIKENELMPELIASFARMRNEGRNGLFIWEGASQWIEKLLPYIHDFEIRVVATYRRLFDFLPSFYSQNIKKYEFPDNDNIGPVPFDFFDQSELDHLEASTKFARDFRWLAYFNGTHRAKDRLDAAAALNITSLAMMDFHAKYDNEIGNDLCIEFFCSGAVPGSNHTCEAAKRDQLKGTVTWNERLKVDYFILAFHAFKKGIAKRRPDTAMVVHIQNAMENHIKGKKFKKICMSESRLEKLHDLSWKHEKAVYPKRDEQRHRIAFEEFKAKEKHCSLDVVNLLDSEEMQQWMTSWNFLA